jgi:hypothetical protein
MNRTFDVRPGEVVVLVFKRTLIGDPRLNSTPMQNFGWPVVEGQPTILPMRLFLKTNPRLEGEWLMERGDVQIIDAERGVLSVPLDIGDHAARAAFLNHTREEVQA